MMEFIASLIGLCIFIPIYLILTKMVERGRKVHVTGTWRSPDPMAGYVRSVMAAAENLHGLLVQTDEDAQARYVLDNVHGMDLGDLARLSPFKNAKITFFVMLDLIKCYRRMGNFLDVTDTPEMLGLLIAASKVVRFGDGIACNWTDPAWRQRMTEPMAKALQAFNDGVATETGHDDELLYCMVFGRDIAKPDFAQRYAVLIYRWASLLAKADGTVTEQEREWLAHIMGMAKDEPAQGIVPASAIDLAQLQQVEPQTTPMEELDALTGLGPVKDQVKTLARLVAVNGERRARGMKVAPVSYHCVFTGNPGTGKTTVARILAGIFRDLGVLKKGHLVETDRSGLVAEYVGQTAMKTNKVVDSALDGMLFVDEAYSLVGGGSEDYGREAIATLLKRMEDDRSRLVVVLAGYTDDMERFIASNPGLKSRFSRFIEFPDYSAAELAEIFLSFVKRNQYVCTSGAMRALKRRIAAAVARRGKDFGNARFVRNLFERAIERQAARLAGVAPLTPEILEQLATEDIENG